LDAFRARSIRRAERQRRRFGAVRRRCAAAVLGTRLRPQPELDAELREQRRERQIVGAADRAVEELAELDAADLLGKRLEAVLRHADAFRAVTAPQLADDIVEARRRAAAQLEV